MNRTCNNCGYNDIKQKRKINPFYLYLGCGLLVSMLWLCPVICCFMTDDFYIYYYKCNVCGYKAEVTFNNNTNKNE